MISFFWGGQQNFTQPGVRGLSAASVFFCLFGPGALKISFEVPCFPCRCHSILQSASDSISTNASTKNKRLDRFFSAHQMANENVRCHRARACTRFDYLSVNQFYFLSLFAFCSRGRAPHFPRY